MAIKSIKAGPGTIRFPQKVSTLLPTLLGMAFTASALTGGTTTNNSAQNALVAGTNYQIAIGLTGWDTVTQGYAVTPTTVSSGNVQVANNGDVIVVTVPLANWPANYQYCAFVIVFIKTGAGSFQPVLSVPIDSLFTARNFEVIIDHVPLAEVTQYPIATLTGSAVSNTYPGLGTTRAPAGFLFSTLSPTTDSTNIRYLIGNSITFSPNNASDFTGVGSRPVGLDFKTEFNDLQTLVEATAGNSTYATLGSGTILRQATQGLSTGNVFLKGNLPVIFISPVDPATGASDVELFTGLLLQNSAELTLAWSKKAETPVTWNFANAPLDYLNDGCDTFFAFNVH